MDKWELISTLRSVMPDDQFMDDLVYKQGFFAAIDKAIKALTKSDKIDVNKSFSALIDGAKERRTQTKQQLSVWQGAK